MAYDNISGVSVGSFVRNTKHRLKIPVGEFLRGRIIDATGKPIDSLGAFESSRHYYVDNTYINPLDRPPITDTLDFGVKAIDGLNTVGKRTTYQDFRRKRRWKEHAAWDDRKNVKADINVIAPCGRARQEVREFVEKRSRGRGTETERPCGCDIGSAGDAADEMPVGCDNDRGVF